MGRNPFFESIVCCHAVVFVQDKQLGAGNPKPLALMFWL